MLIRIFYGGQVRDFKLEKDSKFSVGSGQKDTLSIPQSDLRKKHVLISSSKETLEMTCRGNVYFQGEKVNRAVLQPSDTYLLSSENSISLIAVEEQHTPCAALHLDDCEEVSIGRVSGNTIVLDSSLISKCHALIYKRGNGYLIRDNGSTNGTYVDSQRVKEAPLCEECQIVLGDVTLCIQKGDLLIFYRREAVHVEQPCQEAVAAEGSVQFTRSPRLKLELPVGELEIEPPPSIGGKPEINWLAILLPIVVTIGLSLFMTFVMGNAMMMLYTLPMTGSGLVVSISNYGRQNKKYKQQTQTRLQKYTEHLDGVIGKIEKSQRNQLDALIAADPDTNSCFRIAKYCERRLWERRPLDKDFGKIRLGSGSVPSSVKIVIPKAELSLEQDELKLRPQVIQKRYQKVDGAPILCDILTGQICGIVGSHTETLQLLKNMIVQFSTHHCYTEAKLILIYSPEDEAELGWVKALPHTADDEKKAHYLARSKEDSADLLQSFVEVLKNRRLDLMENGDSFGAVPLPLPYCLFVIAQPAFLSKNSPINEFLFRSRDLGAGVILVTEDIVQLPKECNFIVEVKKGQGELYHKNNIAAKQQFQVDLVDPQRFAGFSEHLSQIVCEEDAEKSALPKKYSFYEMLGISNIDEFQLSKQWNMADRPESMAAPVGIGEDGKLVCLDLHEKAHGPHGLVAGTTGSGKSEILQTYILSMALLYHPYEVGFVIIDFKGGGMANQFEQLPHLLGSITNIEGREIERSLASIKAELLKRQRLFADYGVNSIDKYIEKYRAGQTEMPLPHLIIIVDEFAELKAEQPEFMKELISAARIGRSLGVHLILATQKPAGQVNEQIWSNSRFKLCLKVATREDSNEVLKSSLAFSIKEPGRAYLQVGNNEVFSLFQSAYSGQELAEGRTQLDAVVDFIRDYCQKAQLQKLPNICLPSLAAVIKYTPAGQPPTGRGIWGRIGWYDAPDSQEQGELCINFSENNLIIIGSPQSGKTNILQTILRDLSTAYSSSQISLYVVDFGSMLLKNFERLNHVGGVVSSAEDEKMENLFKMLTNEVVCRKEVFAKRGVSSYLGYLDAGFTDLPQVILLIDNLTVLQEIFPEEDELLLGICREGLAVGISVVVANAQTGGLGFKYLLNFSKRIGLYCNDSGEYNTLFDRSRLSVKNLPGRALTELDHQIVEAQMFLSFEGEREIDRVNAMQRYVEEANSRDMGCGARPIPMVPELVTVEQLERDCYTPQADNYKVPIGLDYADMHLISVDLLKTGILAVAGREQSGKTNLTLRILHAIQRNIFSNLTYVYLIDEMQELEPAYSYGCVQEYACGAAEAAELIDSVFSQLQDRKASATSSKLLQEGLKDQPLLMLVLSGPELIDQLIKDQKTGDKLLSIAKDLKRYKGFVLLSDLTDDAVNYASPALLKFIKESKNLIVLDDIQNIRLLEIPIKLQKEFSREIRRGDGFSFIGGKVRKLRMILDETNEKRGL